MSGGVLCVFGRVKLEDRFADQLFGKQTHFAQTPPRREEITQVAVEDVNRAVRKILQQLLKDLDRVAERIQAFERGLRFETSAVEVVEESFGVEFSARALTTSRARAR